MSEVIMCACAKPERVPKHSRWKENSYISFLNCIGIAIVIFLANIEK